MTQAPSNSTLPLRGPGDPAAGATVDVWAAWVDGDAPVAALAVLDRDELDRAGRFRFPRDRGRFVARRAFYRRVLGARLGIPPEAVELRMTPLGRPFLDRAWGIDFSTSHDDGLAVIAVTSGRRVGLDVERLRSLDDALDLARTSMTAREVALLEGQPASVRARGFLELWTRKEAVAKALGVGLWMSFSEFDCSDADPMGVCHPTGVPGGDAWSIIPLDGWGTHLGYVAIEASDVSIRLMEDREVAA